MQNNDPTVHVIDDDELTREFLTQLLTAENYQVKTYDSANSFLSTFSDDGIGCLIIDLRLPGISGLDLQQKLTEKGIDLPFIIITCYGDVDTAVRAMKAGAVDFIEKPLSPQILLERIHKCIEKHHEIKREKTIHDNFKKRAESLTAREREVIDLVVGSYQNKDIASKLGISIKTVEVHRANAMEKMEASSIIDLVRMSLNNSH